MKFLSKKEKKDKEIIENKPLDEKKTEITEKKDVKKSFMPKKSGFGWMKKEKEKTDELKSSPRNDDVTAEQSEVISKKSEQILEKVSTEDTSELKEQESFETDEQTISATKRSEGGDDTNELKRIFKILATKNLDSINPTINFEKNSFSYPILSSLGLDPQDTSYLDRLSESNSGILEKEIYERLLVCPDHPENYATTIRRYCANCNSLDVQKLHLVEHRVCGYIGELHEYGTDSIDLIQKCPNCKRGIADPEKEIRIPGRWNICNSCKEKFDNPIIKIHCRKGEHDFDITDAQDVLVSCYKISSKAGENLQKPTLITPLKKILTTYGFTVETYSSVTGKSGMKHETSIYASNNSNQTIVVFIKSSQTKMVDDSEINSIFVSVLDISPTKTILVAIPDVSERAKTMAKSHGIKVVTGKNPDDIVSKIESILSTEISVPVNSPESGSEKK